MAFSVFGLGRSCLGESHLQVLWVVLALCILLWGGSKPPSMPPPLLPHGTGARENLPSPDIGQDDA